MDHKRSILLNSFVEYIRSLLDMAEQNFTYESVFRFLRTNLAGFSFDEVDRLETVSYTHLDVYKRQKETLRVVSQNISFALIVKVLILILATIGYFGMWEAILAEVGVMFAAILNAVWVVRYTV